MGSDECAFTSDDRQLITELNIKAEQQAKDMAELKGTMQDVAKALTKLAVVEERQSQVALSVERAFTSLSKIEAKVDGVTSRVVELEKQSPDQIRVRRWVDRAIAGIVGLALMYVIKRIAG